MADVIDLTTPPQPESMGRRPLSPKNTLSTPFPRFTFNDDIDALLALDDTIDKPSGGSILSSELDRGRETGNSRVPSKSASQPVNPLFDLFDDDAIRPSTSAVKDRFNPSKAKVPRASSCGPLESDPIVFTSSAPEAGNADASAVIAIDDEDDDDALVGTENRGKKKDLTALDDLEDLDELLGVSDVDEAPAPPSNGLSSMTANLLARLEKHSSASTGKGSGKRKPRDEDDDDMSDDVIKPKKPVKKGGKSSAAKEEKEARARERAAAKAQRERERELEKERKQRVKEEKARQKKLEADIAEANKLKIDKKESTPEMIIDMASSMRDTSVATQLVEYMKHLGVEYTFFSSSIANIVKWRRKTKAIFNDSVGHWEPCPLFIGNERHVLCLVPAQEFVDMILASDHPGSGVGSLDTHVEKIKSVYVECKPIYLIEGLTPWMKKNRNARNRLYQAEYLRHAEDESVSSQPQARRKGDNTRPVDDDRIEDALLQLQVTHACLIHHTNAAPESAQWIKNFTEHVSTIPYRHERMVNNDSAFCMDTGQVKTGDDKTDTFIKMLQEINRVTASMAHGIVTEYPSVVDLIRAMRVHGSGTLEDVRVCCCPSYLFLFLFFF